MILRESDIRRLGYYGDFGTASMTQEGVDCPASGSWEAWCDCVFKGDNTNLAKCKGWAIAAPWTDVGAGLRGIPKPGSWIASVLGTATQVATAPTALIGSVVSAAGQTISTGIQTLGQTRQAEVAAQAAATAAHQQAAAQAVETQSKTVIKIAAIGGAAVLLGVGALTFLRR